MLDARACLRISLAGHQGPPAPADQPSGADLPAERITTLQDAAVTAFHALALRDYARFDFRLATEGTPYLIEANPNPHLHSASEFARAARASGRTHPRMIREIVEYALRRYGVKA